MSTTRKKYDATESDSDKKMREFEAKNWITENHKIKENVDKVCSYICWKCSPTIKGNIEGLDDYETKLEHMDIVWLIEEVKK